MNRLAYPRYVYRYLTMLPPKESMAKLHEIRVMVDNNTAASSDELAFVLFPFGLRDRQE
jgi:hypothetical protein